MKAKTVVNVVNIIHIINANYLKYVTDKEKFSKLENLISNILAHIIEYGPLPNEAGLVNLTLEKELILIIKNLNIKTGIKCVVSVHIIDNYMHLMITS